MSNSSTKKGQALVVHSGGADSTICLHWALENFEQVSAITFDYGQRHRIELKAARKICQNLGIKQKTVRLSCFAELGGNSLLDHDQTIDGGDEDHLPNTFVPGRNILFLTAAAAWCYQLKVHHLVTGVCQTDFSGYPDCRNETIQSLEKTLSLGMEVQLEIHTPLMFLSKAESIELAVKLKALDSLKLSHTCYEGQIPPCGQCPSCILRQKGFAEAGVPDPLLEACTK